MKKVLTLTMTIVGLFLSASSFASIWGSFTICTGSTTMLMHDSLSTSGTWYSLNTAVATIGAPYGAYGVYVNGVSAGTATISFAGTSGSSTAVVTVNPAPAAISGGSTSFCVGTTTSMTCSPSGGTWSSGAPSIASVGISSGVATGISGGTCTIYYTIGSCSSTTVLTVNPGAGIDSISGTSSICVGSTTAMSSTLSGGTWTSTPTSVATVSSTGVVTGVAAGTAVITHATTGTCGTSIATHIITVTSTTSAGTISGPTSVGSGGTIPLSSTVSGGTWSTSSSAIATISGTGVVTGVSVGTVVITYTVTGCGSASSTYTVTVTAPNCISGHVLFTGAPYYGPVRVWLIKYNAAATWLSAVDSTYAYASGDSAAYSFCGMGTDSFRVKAAVDSITSGFAGYLPTYHTSSAYWNTATVIYHLTGTNDVNKNITMGYGTTTSGPGFIAGDVTTGANKGTAGGPPAVGMLIYCVNNTTGAILQSTKTDAAGHYSFSNLPVGEQYKIYPEEINYATTPYPAITLTSSSTSMTVADFVQHTLSHTITPITAAVGTVATTSTSISIFPNPASGTLNVQWNVANAGTGTISVTDITGRVVLSNTIDMTANNGNTRLNISGINAGLYMVTIKANGVNYNTKVAIK